MNFNKWTVELAKYSSLVGAGLAIYDLSHKQHAVQKQEAILNQNIQDLKKEVLSKSTENIDKMSEVESKILGLKDRLENSNYSFDQFQNAIDRYKDSKQNLNSEHFNQLKAKAAEEFGKLKDSVAELEKLLSSRNNFRVEDFTDQIGTYREYLTTLSIEQHIALIHLCLTFTMFFALISITSIFYGDLLIKYYDLEVKFPKLAKFISIRRKLQFYYFTWNLILIILVLFTILYLNFITFYGI